MFPVKVQMWSNSINDLVIKDIVETAMNASGTLDTALVLGISKDTVTAALKLKKLRASVSPVNEAYLKKIL